MIDKFEWGLDLVGTNIQSGFDETAFLEEDVIEELAGIKSRNYDFVLDCAYQDALIIRRSPLSIYMICQAPIMAG